MPLEFRCYLVYELRSTYLKFWGRNLGFSTSGDLLTRDYHQYNTSEMSAAENVGAVVRIVFLTSVEMKIYCMLYAVHKL